MIGQVQIDQSVLGWKEYELEVVRDGRDNCIIVCGIENIDAMGDTVIPSRWPQSKR